MSEPTGKLEFNIPQNFLEQLYEFSGGANKYKGMVIALCSERGSPIVYSKFESPIMELGLKKAIEDYINDQNMNEEETDL